MTTVNLIDARTTRLDRAAALLRYGALAHAASAVIVLIIGVVGALSGGSGVFELLRSALLFAYNGAADAAIAVLIVLTLLSASLLLVVMVGVIAREIWALPALIGVALVAVALLVVFGFTPALITLIACALTLVTLNKSLSAFRINPVMLKELRGRMRGVRAFAVITVYLSLMSGFAALLYLVYGSATRVSASAAAGEIGRVLFLGVVGIELLLILFIAPAFTAGAITGERERQTYDLLQTTLLSPQTFVIGKLESALGYILLLLLSGIPLQSIAFLFGGVSEIEIILSLVILIVTAVALGTVGMYFSAAQQRTLTASVRAYSTIIAAMFILPILLSVVLNVLYDLLLSGSSAPAAAAVEALLRYADLLLTSANPIAAGLASQRLVIDQGVIGAYTYTLSSTGATIPMIAPWITFSVLYLALSAGLIVATIASTRQQDANA